MKKPQQEEWMLSAKRRGLRAYINELWFYRRLTGFLSTKILEKQYQRSLLGRVWIIIRPLMTVLMYTVLFGIIFSVETKPLPYLLFMILGFTIWTTFDRSLVWATRSMETVRGIMRKVYFPRLLIPVAGLASGLIDLAIFLLYIIVIGLYYWLFKDQSPLTLSWELLAALVSIALTFYFSLALSLWTSVFDAIGRDMRYSLRYIMQVWMFCTPVMYPVERIPPSWRWVMEYNPMTPLVANFRAALAPQYEVAWSGFMYPFLVASLIFATGMWLFLEFEGETVDSF